jgi:hypothetical protein
MEPGAHAVQWPTALDRRPLMRQSLHFEIALERCQPEREMEEAGFRVDRRSLLSSAVMLVGGSLASGIPTGLLAASMQAAPLFFSAEPFAVLSEVADIVIPRTDTPGARDAGVPAFIDALMAHWASAEHRQQTSAQIAAIADAARAAGGTTLSSLPRDKRIALVRAHDEAGFAAGDPGWLKLKELILVGYYWSEPGATRELRYELAPGVWEPKLELNADTRGWAL